MGHLQPLYQVTIGRSREVRGPDGMEAGIVGVIMAAVMVVAVGFGARLIPMVQTLDAVSLVSTPAYNEVIYYAAHGRWPAAGDPNFTAGNSKGFHVNELKLGADGVITAQLAIGPILRIGAVPSDSGAGTIHGALSFRPELLGSRDAPTVSFLCGYAQPVVDPAAKRDNNMTTLDKQILPPFCR